MCLPFCLPFFPFIHSPISLHLFSFQWKFIYAWNTFIFGPFVSASYYCSCTGDFCSDVTDTCDVGRSTCTSTNTGFRCDCFPGYYNETETICQGEMSLFVVVLLLCYINTCTSWPGNVTCDIVRFYQYFSRSSIYIKETLYSGSLRQNSPTRGICTNLAVQQLTFGLFSPASTVFLLFHRYYRVCVASGLVEKVYIYNSCCEFCVPFKISHASKHVFLPILSHVQRARYGNETVAGEIGGIWELRRKFIKRNFFSLVRRLLETKRGRIILLCIFIGCLLLRTSIQQPSIGYSVR